MAKVLLVEDDNNLREIYEARLAAEGYQIVSAQDGEAALTVAKAETPDLIISDVMMPRVSGFEMLDILRNTQGLKDVKVIMLTALGQVEDQSRAGSLGANRYLVKSQVTLEDIVKAAAELLGGAAAPADAAAPAPDAATAPAAAPQAPAPEPVAVAVEPAAPAPEATPAPPQVTPVAAAPAPEPVAATPVPAVDTPATTPAPAPLAAATPPAPATTPAPTASEPAATPAAAPAAPTSSDAVLANAVQDLLKNTEEPAPATTPMASSADPATTAPDPVAPPAAPAPTPPMPEGLNPVPTPVDTDSITVGGQRVIQPLAGAGHNSSLDSLLAKEDSGTMEHDEAAGMTSIHAPGHVITPSGGGATPTTPPADDATADPNKIAL